jgi:hypothetical protein
MPNPSLPDTPIRRRRKPLRLRRTLAILIVLMLLPVAAFVVWGRIESARVSGALDALEARGEPLDVNRLEPAPATDEQRQASRFYAEAGRLAYPAHRTPFNVAGKTIEELCALPAGDPGRVERLAAMRRLEDPYAPALAVLDRATALDANGWDGRDRAQQWIETMRSRYLATVNALRVARYACGGEGEAAAAALLGTLRLGRVLSSSLSPPLSMPTAHGLQSMLTLTAPSERALERLQDAYTAAADDRTLERWLLYSRARWLSVMLPGELSDVPEGYYDRRISPLEAVANSLIRPLRDHALVAELGEYAEAIEAAKQPWPASLDAAAALSRKYSISRAASPRRRGIIETLARPLGRHIAAGQIDGFAPLVAESLARTRASIAALAIERYRRSHHGATPATLRELIPAYLPASLVDPYTGGELRYVSDGARYKVYSVGFNRQDDGGAWEQRSDLQTARRGNPKDVGIAVGAWPPAAVR